MPSPSSSSPAGEEEETANQRRLKSTLQMMELQQEKHQQELAQAKLLAKTKEKQLEDVSSALHAQIEALQYGQQAISAAVAGERLVDDALKSTMDRQRKEKLTQVNTRIVRHKSSKEEKEGWISYHML